MLSYISLSLIFFVIMDPFGAAPTFAQSVSHLDPKRQRWVLGRELLFALALMGGFAILGEHIFHFLEITEPAVRVGSGIILFLVSIRILFPSLDIEFHRPVQPGEEPWLVPLAIPAIAGPSLLATVMLFAHIEPSWWKMLTSMLTAWSLTALIILFSPEITKKIRSNFLEAIEKLMGMVLILLAVQRLLEGVIVFLRTKGLL